MKYHLETERLILRDILPTDEAAFFEMDSNVKITLLEVKILHCSYTSVVQHVGKVDYFSTIAAMAYHAKGKKPI